MSTGRAETAAALVALLADRPLHLAIDNASTCYMLDDIIKGYVDTHKKPWALRVNGGFWELIERS